MDYTRPSVSRGIMFLLVILILGAVVLLNHIGWLNMNSLLAEVRTHRDNWWLILALVVAQIILYTFALSGSYALWLVAPVYSPVVAAAILAIGGTLGAISAYYFSRKVSDRWTRRVENSRVYRLLQQHDNFFTIFALRVLPGFPHGLISYSAGILKCKPYQFAAASITGFVIKFYIYSSLVYEAAGAFAEKTSFNVATLSPLILLSALSLLAMYIRHRLATRPA